MEYSSNLIKKSNVSVRFFESITTFSVTFNSSFDSNWYNEEIIAIIAEKNNLYLKFLIRNILPFSKESFQKNLENL